MPSYEYNQIFFDIGDLNNLNRLAADGWRVIHAATKPQIDNHETVVLLERILPEFKTIQK